MSIFKKKPTEYELELIVLRAAEISKAKELDTNELTSKDDMISIIKFSFSEANRKADSKSMNFALMGVQALLVEGDFIEELLMYRHTNPGEPIPSEFRGKMLDAIQKSVDDFLAQK